MVVDAGRVGVLASISRATLQRPLRGSAAEPAVGPVVVAVDVTGGLLPCVLGALPIAAPTTALPELAEGQLDERLRLRVARATPPVA